MKNQKITSKSTKSKAKQKPLKLYLVRPPNQCPQANDSHLSFGLLSSRACGQLRLLYKMETVNLYPVKTSNASNEAGLKPYLLGEIQSERHSSPIRKGASLIQNTIYLLPINPLKHSTCPEPIRRIRDSISNIGTISNQPLDYKNKHLPWCSCVTL